MEILTAAVTLLLIMDPLGNIPVFMSVLNQLDPQRRHRMLVRELLISLAVLLVFLFLGGEQARWPKSTNRGWRKFNRCLKVWLGRQEEKTITGRVANDPSHRRNFLRVVTVFTVMSGKAAVMRFPAGGQWQ